MTRTLYEAAALVYGLVVLVMLTVIAMWLGDRDAVIAMLGALVFAYGCQVFTAIVHVGASEGKDFALAFYASLVLWALSAACGAWAIVLMVLQ